MINWIQKLHTSQMQHKKTRWTYYIDKDAMVAYIDVNKPEKHIIGDDRHALDTLTNHFAAAGYCVIVRD